MNPPEANKAILSLVGERTPDIEEAATAIYDPSSLTISRPINENWTESSTRLICALADDLLQDGPLPTNIVVWDADEDNGEYWAVRGAVLEERTPDRCLVFSKDQLTFRVDVESNMMLLSC